MSYRKKSYVMYGSRIEADIDWTDEEYLPHVEGHPGVDILMLNSEKELNVWYIGVVLASNGDETIYQELRNFDNEEKSWIEIDGEIIALQIKILGKPTDGSLFRAIPRKLFILNMSE